MSKHAELEKEIVETSSRIGNRHVKIEVDLASLENRIKAFTRWAWSFVWIGIGVIPIGVISYYLNYTQNAFGLNLLGDFLSGCVGSLWSLAGLFFIYVAFLGQKQQLLHQQLEIMYSQLEVKYTRLELEGQKNELIEQNKTLRTQRFENTFFQLLRNHQDIVNSIDIRSRKVGDQSAVMAQGRDCFKRYYEKFAKTVGDKTIEKTLENYLAHYHHYQSDLGH